MDKLELLNQAIESFLAHTESHGAIAFATGAASEFQGYPDLRQTWQHVGRILQYAFAFGVNELMKLEASLGSRVVARLYRYYLRVHLQYHLRPDGVLVTQELCALLDRSKWSESDFEEVYRLQADVTAFWPELKRGYKRQWCSWVV